MENESIVIEQCDSLLESPMEVSVQDIFEHGNQIKEVPLLLGTSKGASVEFTSFDDNALEEFPPTSAYKIQPDYHLIDEKNPSVATNVIVCNSLSDVENIVKKRNEMKKMCYRYQCDLCNKIFSSAIVLKTHKVRHLLPHEKPFKCEIEKCPFTAASKMELQKHSSRHHQDSEIVLTMNDNRDSSDACIKTCSNLDTNSINKVDKTVTNESLLGTKFAKRKCKFDLRFRPNRLITKLRCGLCTFSCSSLETLSSHLQSSSHSRDRQRSASLACPICAAIFSTSSNLNAHLMSHADERKFQCDECSRSFNHKKFLVAHMKFVHSPKTFQCPYCNKTFARIHLLSRHERIHTGEKPFQCCFCAYACNVQNNLVKHVRTRHNRPEYTYKVHLRESGQIKMPVPTTSELEKLQAKGAEAAHRFLASLDTPGLDVETLRQRVEDRKMKVKLKQLPCANKRASRRKQKTHSIMNISAPTEANITATTRTSDFSEVQSQIASFANSNNLDTLILCSVPDTASLAESKSPETDNSGSLNFREPNVSKAVSSNMYILRAEDDSIILFPLEKLDSDNTELSSEAASSVTALSLRQAFGEIIEPNNDHDELFISDQSKFVSGIKTASSSISKSAQKCNRRSHSSSENNDSIDACQYLNNSDANGEVQCQNSFTLLKEENCSVITANLDFSDRTFSDQQKRANPSVFNVYRLTRDQKRILLTTGFFNEEDDDSDTETYFVKTKEEVERFLKSCGDVKLASINAIQPSIEFIDASRKSSGSGLVTTANSSYNESSFRCVSRDECKIGVEVKQVNQLSYAGDMNKNSANNFRTFTIVPENADCNHVQAGAEVIGKPDFTLTQESQDILKIEPNHILMKRADETSVTVLEDSLEHEGTFNIYLSDNSVPLRTLDTRGRCTLVTSVSAGVTSDNDNFIGTNMFFSDS